jgi:putative FmdB family regulatory protein
LISLIFSIVPECAMPIYAYRCASCGFEQDVLQKVSEDPLTDCPSCGKPTLSKQVTAAGFQLKGSGWYVTDFRDSGKKPAEGATSVPGPKTDTARAAAGESTPAAGGETSKSDASAAAPAAAAPAPSAPASAAPAGSKPAGQ